MLLRYENNHFRLGEVTFTLPYGALIELTPEVIYDGVMLRRADGLAMLEIFLQKGTIASHSLMQIVGSCVDAEPDRLEEIKSVSHNGIQGLQATYHVCDEEYFELYLSCCLETVPSTLLISLMTRPPLRRADALAHPDLRGILDSIRIAPSLPPSYPTRARPFIHKTFLLCSQIFSFFLARTML